MWLCRVRGNVVCPVIFGQTSGCKRQIYFPFTWTIKLTEIDALPGSKISKRNKDYAILHSQHTFSQHFKALTAKKYQSSQSGQLSSPNSFSSNKDPHTGQVAVAFLLSGCVTSKKAKRSSIRSGAMVYPLQSLVVLI